MASVVQYKLNIYDTMQNLMTCMATTAWLG
jgi:hypothetical protein